MTRRTFVVLVWFGLTGPIPAAEPIDLASWISHPSLWTSTSETITRSLPTDALHWLSDRHEAAHIAKGTTMRLDSIDVSEVMVRFREDRISSIEFSLFNRADSAPLSRDAFLERVNAASAWLSKHTGSPAKEDDGSASVAKAHRRLWQTDERQFVLSYSFQRARKSRDQPFQAEFIRVQMRPALEPIVSKRGAEWLVKQVRKETNGDVWISGVPMIDQGDKGYCVVASAERVLRYYGVEVSQNELAQIAASHRDRGTSIAAMTDALRGETRVLQVHVRELYSLFGSRSLKQLVDRYNRQARREKEALLGYDADFFSKAKPALILASRTTHAGFQSDLHSAIQLGTPLLWSVHLGLFPEQERPQAQGGHMRLIIGYNEKAKEVIYTDSWGPGHEKKRFPIDKAFAMTLAMSVLEPND